MSARNSVSLSAAKSTPAEASLSPVTSHSTITDAGKSRAGSPPDDTSPRQVLLAKVGRLLRSSIARSRTPELLDFTPPGGTPMSKDPSSQNTIVATPRPPTPFQRGQSPGKFKETKHVSLEFDPKSRRKVLNTYEILREIGRGEHGKVKLAKNLENGELVAIKIVSRRSKNKSLRMRRPSNAPPSQQFMNDYEAKIKREIAIMKRCDHKYIVKFKEVLDDVNSFKIYLVLEYMDRGEIMWKRQSPLMSPRPSEEAMAGRLPCFAGRKSVVSMNGACVATEDNDLLSYEYSPNLTFKQSRKVLRDVLLGLEYLHMQGIVHRDIKPANLLVSSDYTVKISDFGVSFASSLGSTEDGIYFSDMELAKTVGTPAFFAPELCQTSTLTEKGKDEPEASNGSSEQSTSTSKSSSTLINDSKERAIPKNTSSNTIRSNGELPRVDHKIDIWALGVTLYCLLFGRVPFNADSEFALFDVIVHQELEFPESRSAFHSPNEVSEHEFELAKDLLRKFLDKNSATRIDIADIKRHPFVLMDLENDADKLHEFFFLNLDYSLPAASESMVGQSSRPDSSSHAIGIARTAGGGTLLRALNSDSPSSSMEHVDGPKADPKELSKIDTGRVLDPGRVSDPGRMIDTGRVTDGRTSDPGKIVDTGLRVTDAGLKLADNYDQGLSPTTPQTVFTDSFGSRATSISPQFTGSGTSMPRRSASHGKSSSLLQDILDASSLRRDSSGSQEAPQIETKRNVGGDLYMKNQSAIDAFKDIQKTDKKRRKSSIFATNTPTASSPVATRGWRSSEDDSKTPDPTASIPITSPTESSSKIKVGPISIGSTRRPSSTISLPLTESFASLDSFNDEYLTSKYQEFHVKKQAMKKLTEGYTQSDSALVDDKRALNMNITEKFRDFNLGTSMAKQVVTPQVTLDPSHDDVGPRGTTGSRFPPAASRTNSSSSYSSCSSGSSSDSEEEGNLTLKFSSKVVPKSRPPFLTLGNRALSHDSRLTDLGSPKSYPSPFILPDKLDDLEDLPESLIGAGSDALSIEISPKATPTSKFSSPPIAPDIRRLRNSQAAPAQSSPLRQELRGSPDTAIPSPTVSHPIAIPQEPVAQTTLPYPGGYFNNHYKKEHVRSPFPFAKHLDADRESQFKIDQKQTGDLRPSCNRSNSITLGILQHERSEENLRD